MKINSTLPSVNPTGTAASKAADATAKATKAPAGERIDISSLSVQLQEVGAGETPFDVQKVAEIKQAISEGRFQINPERIADGLLNSVREMLAAKR